MNNQPESESSIQLVSLFNGARARKPKENLSPAEVLKWIREGQLRESIERIRSVFSTAQSEGRDAKAAVNHLKLALPAVTWSGTFKSRNAESLQCHSGLICMDLDALPPERIESLRRVLREDPRVVAWFLSPTATGLKVLFRCVAAEEHKRSFQELAEHMFNAHGVPVDRSGSDVCRLCFLSYDPQAWWRDGLITTPITPEQAPTAATRDRDDREYSETLCTLSAQFSLSTLSSGGSMEEIVGAFVPSQGGQNHDALFRLARLVKAPHRLHGGGVREWFECWYRLSTKKGTLRPGLSKDDYWLEFNRALNAVKHPMGEGPAEQAMKRVRTEPPPPEAEQFEDESIRLLVGLCWQLHKISNGAPWFLSCRQAAVFLGTGHNLAAHRLAGLVSVGILEVVEPGNSRRATRYRYVPKAE